MTFDREYFEGDNQTIGYRHEGFRDFSVHFTTVDRIMSMKPTSVLELGGARGYVAKKLIAIGVPTTVIEISDHCFHTRAVEQLLQHDIEKSPYPFVDKQFDLVFSDSVMEHLHYDKIDAVIKEITRVSKRSLHGIPLTDSGQSKEQFMGDNTHVIFESKSWWTAKFLEADPDHKVEISGDILGDAGNKVVLPPVSFDGSDIVKLNVGSFINMFYYGWSNTDILDIASFANHYGYIFKQHDSTKPFPVQDVVVDLIFTSHMLEHLKREDAERFLKECYRMMKPGAHIRIAVPSTGLLMQQYIDHDLDYLKHINPLAEKAKCDIDKFSEVALSNHLQLYDQCSLRFALERAGFKDISLSDPFHSRSAIMENETIVSHPTISLVMEATK
jgi:predicted SAM-dependent methyltransferase